MHTATLPPPSVSRPNSAPPKTATLYGRFSGLTSIGWVLIREDGTIASTGAVDSLARFALLALLALLAGVPRVVITALTGELPAEAIAYAQSRAWEIVP